jgi:hypothetical protein
MSSNLTQITSERNARMALNRQKAMEMKLTTPLEADTYALKLKELRKRFPFAEFHMIDSEKGLSYKIDYNRTGLDWMPEMLWYKDDCSYPFYYSPRSYKIEITTGGIKKDITYLF